jgi:hypothetical protein
MLTDHQPPFLPRESLSPRSARARLSRDTEHCQALTTWLHTYNHHGPRRIRRPTHATRMADLSNQDMRPGYPTGVELLLLSPSASPERVWLYAAELDERLLAPNISMSTPLRSRQHAHVAHSLVRTEFGRPPTPRSPNPCPSVVDHVTGDRARNNRGDDTGNTRLRTEGSADQAGATPNRPGTKLNDAFTH